MAIDAYTGLPRSGKSYSVVKNVILPSLREGRHVYTNIPLTDLAHDEFPDLIHQLPATWYSDVELCSKFPSGSVVILDELWRRWPSGLKSSAANFSDKEFLAEHGHNVDEFGNTTRVVLVTQDLSQISAFARELVDTTYRTTKLDAVGANTRFRVDIYQGAVTGQRPPKTQLLRQAYDKYEEQFYRYYRSSTKSDTGNVGDESRADKRKLIWKSPGVILTLLAPFICFPLAGYLGYETYLNFNPEPELEPQVETFSLVNSEPVPTSIVPAKPVPSRRSNPEFSTVWRVAGSLTSSDTVRFDKQMVVLHSYESGLRRVPLSVCELMPDGFSFQCLVDGKIATPWTGKPGPNDWIPDVGRTVTVTSGATDGNSPSRSSL